MSIALLVEVTCIVAAMCGVMYGYSHKVERMQADHDANEATIRAEKAERVISRDLHVRGCTCYPNPELVAAHDQAIRLSRQTVKRVR